MEAEKRAFVSFIPREKRIEIKKGRHESDAKKTQWLLFRDNSGMRQE